MSSRDTVRDAPLSKASQPGEPAESADAKQAARTNPPVPPAQGKAFDPYRFQANTMPTGLREELLAAKPKLAPEPPFEDTLPPNGMLGERRHADEQQGPASRPSSSGQRSDPVRPVRRSAPTWMIGFGAAIAAFVGILLLTMMRTSSSRHPDAPRAAKLAESAAAPSAPSPHREPPGSEGLAIATKRASPMSASSAPLVVPSNPRRPNGQRITVKPATEDTTAPSPGALPELDSPAPSSSGAFASPLAPPDK
jgi:hypothetical protein